MKKYLFPPNEKLGQFRFLLNIISRFLSSIKILENFAYPRIKIIGRKL